MSVIARFPWPLNVADYDSDRLFRLPRNVVRVYSDNGHYFAVDENDRVICRDSNTACIQEAIDHVKNGGKVLIKKGEYYVDAVRTVSIWPDVSSISANPPTQTYNNAILIDRASYLTIEGEGSATRIVAKPGVDLMIYVHESQFVTIRNLLLDGNKQNQTWQYHDGAGLILSGGKRIGNRYENLTLMNSRGDGLYLGSNVSNGGTDIYEHAVQISGITCINNDMRCLVMDNVVGATASNIVSYYDAETLHLISVFTRIPVVVDGVYSHNPRVKAYEMYYGVAVIRNMTVSVNDINALSSGVVIDAGMEFEITLENVLIDVNLPRTDWIYGIRIRNPGYSYGSQYVTKAYIRNAFVRIISSGINLAYRFEGDVDAVVQNSVSDPINKYGFTAQSATGNNYPIVRIIGCAGGAQYDLLGSYIGSATSGIPTVEVYNFVPLSGSIYAYGNIILDKPYNLPVTEPVRLRYRKNYGRAVFSGDGAKTTFTIPHRLISAPNNVIITPGSAHAAGNFYVTADSNNINIIYSTPPPSGTNNVVIYWYAEV